MRLRLDYMCESLKGWGDCIRLEKNEPRFETEQYSEHGSDEVVGSQKSKPRIKFVLDLMSLINQDAGDR